MPQIRELAALFFLRSIRILSDLIVDNHNDSEDCALLII